MITRGFITPSITLNRRVVITKHWKIAKMEEKKFMLKIKWVNFILFWSLVYDPHALDTDGEKLICDANHKNVCFVELVRFGWCLTFYCMMFLSKVTRPKKIRKMLDKNDGFSK